MIEQQCLSTFSVKGYTKTKWIIYDYEQKKLLKKNQYRVNKTVKTTSWLVFA
jgi:hypothetical protein